MKMLSNPYIIKPEEFIYDEEKESIIIISELFEGKALSNYLNSKTKKKCNSFYQNFCNII